MADHLNVFGKHDKNTLVQLAKVKERADHVALMPDGHLGYIMPIGGVAAYRNHVSVTGVGFDIGCGNMAVRTNKKVTEITDVQGFADEIFDRLAFGVGRKDGIVETSPETDMLWVHDAWTWMTDVGFDVKTLRTKAREQLGTIGGGNHYVDIFVGSDDSVWIGVHFGSRGLGHTIASGFLALTSGEPVGTRVPETEALLHEHHPFGKAYLRAMDLAGKYAARGRQLVVQEVLNIMDATALKSVHNHHNYAWRETHFGNDYYVVRKGATPAWPGQLGFVGGSMGDNAVIVQGSSNLTGRDAHDQKRAMYSTVHGAGRVMGRNAAKGKWKKGVLVEEGAINHKMWKEWMDGVGVTVRGGDLDEAPQAYRRLDQVLQYAPGVEVMEILRPIIVCMAPGDTVDPYKD